jgi:hypothetical protein
VLRAQLVFFRRFSRSNQVAQSLVLRVRNPHYRQISRLVRTRQPFCIAAIGLDPISSLLWYQRRRDHFTGHS